jgi:hypothetical protein
MVLFSEIHKAFAQTVRTELAPKVTYLRDNDLRLSTFLLCRMRNQT